MKEALLVLVIVLAAVLPAQAQPFTIVSQTHHVWGEATTLPEYPPRVFVEYDRTDSVPVSDGVRAEYYPGWWNSAESQAGNFTVTASEHDFTGAYVSAHAESTYVLIPSTSSLNLYFSGYVNSFHYFCADVGFSLLDMDTGARIDAKSWTDDNLAYLPPINEQHNYTCIPGHNYRLYLHASASANDVRGNTDASLSVVITPEPGVLPLLAAGAFLGRRGRHMRG